MDGLPFKTTHGQGASLFFLFSYNMGLEASLFLMISGIIGHKPAGFYCLLVILTIRLAILFKLFDYIICQQSGLFVMIAFYIGLVCFSCFLVSFSNIPV